VPRAVAGPTGFHLVDIHNPEKSMYRHRGGAEEETMEAHQGRWPSLTGIPTANGPDVSYAWKRKYIFAAVDSTQIAKRPWRACPCPEKAVDKKP